MSSWEERQEKSRRRKAEKHARETHNRKVWGFVQERVTKALAGAVKYGWDVKDDILTREIKLAKSWAEPCPECGEGYTDKWGPSLWCRPCCDKQDRERSAQIRAKRKARREHVAKLRAEGYECCSYCEEWEGEAEDLDEHHEECADYQEELRIGRADAAMSEPLDYDDPYAGERARHERAQAFWDAGR